MNIIFLTSIQYHISSWSFNNCTLVIIYCDVCKRAVAGLMLNITVHWQWLLNGSTLLTLINSRVSTNRVYKLTPCTIFIPAGVTCFFSIPCQNSKDMKNIGDLISCFGAKKHTLALCSYVNIRTRYKIDAKCNTSLTIFIFHKVIVECCL